MRSLQYIIISLNIFYVFSASNYVSYDEPLCVVPTNSCGPIMPSASTAFYLSQEITNLEKNLTYFDNEYYSRDRNLLATFHMYQNYLMHTIYDYNLDTIVQIVYPKGSNVSASCKVDKISTSHPWMIGEIDDNQTIIGLNPSQVLLMGPNMKYEYVDLFNIRDVPSNRWDTCAVDKNKNTISIKNYWTDPHNVMSLLGEWTEKPMLHDIEGHINLEYGPVNVKENRHFSYVNFEPKPSEFDHRFEIPTNIYCENLPNEKRPPGYIGSRFTLNVETLVVDGENSNPRQIEQSKIWFMEIDQLVREDGIPNPESVEGKILGHRQSSIIQDAKMRVEYLIDRIYGNCTIIPLQEDKPDITVSGNYISIKNPIEMLKLYKTTYYGSKYARGIKSDVFMGHVKLESNATNFKDNVNYEIYFTDKSWRYETDESSSYPQPIPVQIRIEQDITNNLIQSDLFHVDVTQNIFKFQDLYSESEKALDAFDITRCFKPEEKRRFRLNFPPTARDYLDNNPSVLRNKIHREITEYTSIPNSRLQKLEVEYSETLDVIRAEFTIVDIPLIEGVMKPSGYTGVPLDKAVQNLKNNLNHITIYLQIEPHQNIQWKPYNDSLREIFTDHCAPVNYQIDNRIQADNNKEESTFINFDKLQSENLLYHSSINVLSTTANKPYKSGDMAGMGIGMFILGVIIGSICMAYTTKKLGIKPTIDTIPLNVSYNK